MVEQEYGCAYCHNDGAHDEIDGSVVKDVHSGSALTAGIAAAFHSGRQLIGTAERGNEQGDQNRDECLCPLEEIAGAEIRAACLLCVHDLLRFLDQGRDEPERDGHHHGKRAAF